MAEMGGGQRDAILTKPQSEVDMEQVATGIESIHRHPRRHTYLHPLYLLVQPPALHSFGGHYTVPCYIRIWCQILIHRKIWNLNGQDSQGNTKRIS